MAPDACVDLCVTLRGTVNWRCCAKGTIRGNDGENTYGRNFDNQTNNAANLAAFTQTIDPKKVNDATLGEMVSLLNTDDDGVRRWVAAALGHLGPRAKVAVPTLLDLLRKVDCLEGDLTSAGAIRLALTRIGETPPPQPKCFPKWPSSRR